LLGWPKTLKIGIGAGLVCYMLRVTDTSNTPNQYTYLISQFDALELMDAGSQLH